MACLVVQNQLRSKLLRRALGKRPHLQFDSQRHLPPQVVVSTLFGLVIRDPVVDLQHQRGGQQARRHTRPPVVAAAQTGEVVVAEQIIALRAQEPVEVPPADEVRKQRVGLKQSTLRRPLTEHSPYGLFRSDLVA